MRVIRQTEPWMKQPGKLESHPPGPFNYDTNDEVEMDGWAVLKILNTSGHPQRKFLQRKVHLVQRTVGDKYLRMLAARETIEGCDENDLEHGGGQYVDHHEKAVLRLRDEEEFREYQFLFDVEDYALATGNVEPNSLPTLEDLEESKQEALIEIEMLRLANYKVSYCDSMGRWRERWPRIGDLVDIPQDLATDLESEEPCDGPLTPWNPNEKFKTDERWYDNNRPNYLGFTPDPIYKRMNLLTHCNDNDVNYSILADRKGRNMWEVAVWKLAEHGELRVAEKIQQRYGFRPTWNGQKNVFLRKHVCRFIMWAYRQNFGNNWEFNWICRNIFVHSYPVENWKPLNKVVCEKDFTRNQLVS